MKIFALTALAAFCACGQNDIGTKLQPERVDFQPGSFATINHPVSTLKGQLLYMPVYSNIPYNRDSTGFDMRAYAAIHNTDLFNKIRITRIIYFDHDGKPIHDFLKDGPISLSPLATKDVHIPYEDKSGLGANFLIEWISEVPVSAPLVESVAMSLKGNHTLAILSRGQVIREIR